MKCCVFFMLMSMAEGNGSPLQCSCLENPRDGGAWWAAVYGVAQSRTRLTRLSSSSRLFEFENLRVGKTILANSHLLPYLSTCDPSDSLGVILAEASNIEKTNEVDFTIPYMVYLQSFPEPCVGTLIHPQWVLTAAHCLPPVKIRLGIYQPNIKNQHEQTQSYSMTVPYPDFNSEYLSNDLMMIKLSEAAKLTTQVGTIAIAMEPLSLNESCFIPTWTWSKYKNLSDPDILTWINQYTRPYDECQNMQDERMSVNIMCVGQPLKTLTDIKEVSAAPAICSGRVHGILSWAKGSVTLGNEGFFTEISSYSRWIMSIIESY